MELLISPNSLNDINKLIDLNINSFLFGIDDLSLYQSFYIDIKILKNIISKYPKIKIFVSLNKLMHNNDIKKLNDVLNELNKLKIEGVLYDDLSVIKIVKDKSLNINLIWAGTHLVTNYNTINLLNVKGALISSEITLDEIINIRKNTTKELIVPIFGYQIMTTSYRKFITNYLDFCNIKKIDDSYYLNDKDDFYPIIEDKNGTHILTKDVLNGINEIEKLKEIDYLYLNSLNIKSNIFLKIVDIFQNKKNINEINSLIPNNDTLFFYKESYFKMVDYE